MRKPEKTERLYCVLKSVLNWIKCLRSLEPVGVIVRGSALRLLRLRQVSLCLCGVIGKTHRWLTHRCDVGSSPTRDTVSNLGLFQRKIMKKLIGLIAIVAVCCVLSSVDAGTYSERHRVTPNGRHAHSHSHVRGRASCSAALARSAAFGMSLRASGCSGVSRSHVRASSCAGL